MNKNNLNPCICNIDGKYVVNKMINDGSSIYPTFSKLNKSDLETVFGLNEKEISNIPAYGGFTVLPENNPALFKQSVNIGNELLSLNLYELPILMEHDTLADLGLDDNWDTILDLILKIAPNERPFPDSRFTYLELMLDYLAIAWRKPTQRLPVLVIHSNRSNNYVDLFFDLIFSMFLKNVRDICEEDISSGYNKKWGLAHILRIEEKEISKEMMDLIKEESSSTTRNIISKDFPSFQIPNYSKIIVASDEISNFYYTDKENFPFFIDPLPFPEEGNDDFYYCALDYELPCFLDYLANHHKILTEEESNIWFNFNDIKTPVLNKLQERSKSLFYSEVKKTFKSLFRDSLQFIDESIWEFSLTGFRKAMGAENLKKADIKEMLMKLGVRSGNHKRNFICSISGKQMHAIPYYISNEELKEALYYQNLFPKFSCTEIDCVV